MNISGLVILRTESCTLLNGVNDSLFFLLFLGLFLPVSRLLLVGIIEITKKERGQYDETQDGITVKLHGNPAF